MSLITIYAGDFPTGLGHFTFRSFTLPSDESRGICCTYNVSELDLVHQATKEMAMLLDDNVKIGEAIDSHKADEVMFMARFKEGKRFIGMTNKVTFDKIVKAQRLSNNQTNNRIQRAPISRQTA